MATFQYKYLSKQAAGKNWPIGHSLQPLSQLIPDAQQLMVAEGRAVWPKPTMDSAGRVQQLSADPTLINREIITLKLQAFAGTISCSTWKSNSLPLPEERNFGHRNGGCHVLCRVPDSSRGWAHFLVLPRHVAGLLSAEQLLPSTLAQAALSWETQGLCASVADWMTRNGPLKWDMTCQNLPMLMLIFRNLTSLGNWQRKNNLFFFFLYLYVVIFILIFRVCSYGKQELSEAYLLLWDEWTDLSSIYRAREH